MTKPRLRIGKIPFINLMPIFHILETEVAPDKYEYITGFPSELNRMLRQGKLDISPSSSIEYLRDRDLYDYIEGHSISARGQVKSILLISRVPMESLDGHEIFMTHQSETSIALLKILLEKFYCYNCSYTITDVAAQEALQKHSAFLAIGDEALATAKDAHFIETASKGAPYRVCTIDQQVFYVYDLSQLWYERTALPFVFALWTIKKELSNSDPAAVQEFTEDLNAARDLALARLPELSELPGLALPAQETLKYWEGIIFSLPEDCKKGLELFSSYL
jgi:chorismate dehydratase